MQNIDESTVRGFGDQWSRFTHADELAADERAKYFDDYFGVFPWGELPAGAVGADFGCGTGRWAMLVAPRVGKLYAIDASDEALAVAGRNLARFPNAQTLHASVADVPLAEGSLDFGYCLGVLHHMPDPRAALAHLVSRLKPGAPLLVYMYYAFDDRPRWYREVWRASDRARRVVSRLPHGARYLASQAIAAGVYWPLARTARVLDRLGRLPRSWPLSWYRDSSFYVMRTDALDRFGTRLEQRFTRDELERMMTDAGLDRIVFSPNAPFWVACGRRRL